MTVEKIKPDHVESLSPSPQDVQSPQGLRQASRLSDELGLVVFVGVCIASSSYYMQVPHIFQSPPPPFLFHVQVPV